MAVKAFNWLIHSILGKWVCFKKTVLGRTAHLCDITARLKENCGSLEVRSYFVQIFNS